MIRGKIKILKKLPAFYRVKWIDAFGPTIPWTPVEELDTAPAYCESHGYLVSKTKDYMVFAPHLAPGGHVCGELKIPKPNIVRMVELVEKEDA